MTVTLTGTPVIHTKRLILRAPEPWDAAPFCAFLGSDRARFVGGTTEPGRAWRAFGTILGHWVLRGFGPFTIVRADSRTGAERAIGMAGPWFPDTWPEHEIGWMLWDDAHEGQGLAAEAAAAVRDHARTHLGWATAVSYIDLENARSIALAERLGAVRDPDAAVPPAHPDGGVLGVWRHPMGAVGAAASAADSYERHSHERCTNDA